MSAPSSTTSTAIIARRAEELASKMEAAKASPEDSPIFRPGFWKSKKFVAAAIASVVCFGAAAFTGTLSAQTALLCAAPLLGYLGIEGSLDLASILKRK